MNSPDEALRARQELRKVIAAAFVGTVIEWYDFFLYGSVAALAFNELFFPKYERWTGTMLAFATYSVGFFARPLGGVVFGYIGDRYGRKVALIWTLSIMGSATFLVGCLPTYSSAGVWAPILLVTLRFLQGIAVGGEWGGAVLLTVEHGHRGNRGFYGSWTQAGVPAGNLLATAAVQLAWTLPASQFMSWGWRVPFWFGIVLTILGFVIRRHIQESPLFERQSEETKAPDNPVLSVLRSKWKTVLTVVGARFAENASFYVLTVFILSYADARKVDRNVILQGLLLGSALELVAIPIYGALSDRVGRRWVLMFGTIALSLFAFPFFSAFQTGNTMAIRAILCVFLAIIHAAMYAPQAAFFAEMFGTKLRFSGASLGYQMAAPLAGGLALNISAYLVKWGDGAPWLVAGYLVVIGLISTLTVAFASETSKAELAK